MDVFATGLRLGESPRWHEGRLWVCDWVAGEVLSFDPAGERRVELTMSGLPFSVDWLPDGRTVLTSAQGVVTAAADGSITPYGATGQAWNEIVVEGHGNTFVNSPGFDLMGGEEPCAGTVWVVGPDGSSREVAGDVWFPNGMAVSADGSTLVVAESYGHCLTAFDIALDGSLSRRRVWADLGDAAPDGICFDAEGAIWYADVPTDAVSAWPKVARCWRRWRPTGAASPPCWAARTGERSTSSRPAGAARAGSAPGSRPVRSSPIGRLLRTRADPREGYCATGFQLLQSLIRSAAVRTL